MTNAEIARAYYKHNNLKLQQGSEDSLEAILPFIIMDAVYQLYCTYIKPMNVKGQLAQIRNHWSKTYSQFNQHFFRSFDEDQIDYVVDKMDAFDEYIHNDLEIARISIMDCFRQEGETMQVVASACVLCGVLAVAANTVWKRVHRVTLPRSKYRPYGRTISEENPLLTILEKVPYKYLNKYRGEVGNIDISNDPKVEAAVNVLCRKMIYWLYKCN